MFCTRVFVGAGVALGLLLPVASRAQGTIPTQLPLIAPENMRYLGSFRLPAYDGTGTTEGSALAYGGRAFSVTPEGTLLVSGHQWDTKMCETTLPPIGGMATIVSPCTDVTEGRIDQIGSGQLRMGGSLIHNGRLIVSGFVFYDAAGAQRESHFVSGRRLADRGDALGPFKIDGPTGFVSGYMGTIPSEWQSAFGAPALTGNCCLSIISRTSSGPAVSVFNPDDVGRVTPVPATSVLGYPLSRAIVNDQVQNDFFTRADLMGGVAFPGGTRSVLFVGRHGAGRPCYGEPAPCGDPTGTGKGEHAYPYVHQVWAYDALDLLKVKNRQLEPWEVRPYATWQLTDMNNEGSATIAGAYYDQATRRLYVTPNYGATPTVHVYEITNARVEPPPPAPGALTSTVQDSTVRFSWAPPAGGSWSGYVLEAGSAAGLRDVAAIFLSRTATTFSTAAPQGQFFVRVRATNTVGRLGPASNEVQVNVLGPASPVASPANLRAGVAGDTVVLSWDAPADQGPIAYLLDAGSSSGATNILSGATLGASAPFVASGVPPGRYFARLRAKNRFNRLSPASNEVSFVVGPPATPPSPPGNLQVHVVGNRTVTFSWIAPRSGSAATNYLFEAGAAPGQSDIAIVSLAPITTLPVAGVPPGTYYVRVRSANPAGLSAPSGEVRVVVS